MYKIVRKRALNDSVTLMEVQAPHIAKKAKAGQFIIFRVDEQGERVPLTIADYDREAGTVTIIYQIVGASTKLLNTLEEGDSILDFVGPLGVPTHIDPNAKRVCVIGGGVGTAIAYPQAKALHNAGIAVDMIAGFRSKDIVILDEIDPDGCCILHTDGGYKYHDQDQGTGDITGIFFVHEIPHFSCVMTSLSVKMHKKTR